MAKKELKLSSSNSVFFPYYHVTDLAATLNKKERKRKIGICMILTIINELGRKARNKLIFASNVIKYLHTSSTRMQFLASIFSHQEKNGNL